MPSVRVAVDLSDGTCREALIEWAHIPTPVHVDGYEITGITNKSQVPIRIDIHSHQHFDDGDWEVETLRNLVGYLERDERADVTLSSAVPAQIVVTANPAQLSLPWSENARETRRKEATALGLRDEWEHLTYLVLKNTGLKPEVVKTGENRTPDLVIPLGDIHVPVEVKTFEPNQEEKAARQAATEGRPQAIAGETGLRVIKALRRARGQVAEAAENGRPTIVVLLDPSGLGHTWPDEIAAALEGQITAHVDVSTGDAVVTNVERQENRRRVSHETLGEISAVGVISTCPTKRPVVAETTIVAIDLTLYHNPYATVPLSDDAIAQYGFEQQKIMDAEPRRVYARLIG